MKLTTLRIGDEFSTLDGYEIIKSLCASERDFIWTESHQIGVEREDGSIDFDADIITDECRRWTKSDIAKAMKEVDGHNHKIKFEVPCGDGTYDEISTL